MVFNFDQSWMAGRGWLHRQRQGRAGALARIRQQWPHQQRRPQHRRQRRRWGRWWIGWWIRLLEGRKRKRKATRFTAPWKTEKADGSDFWSSHWLVYEMCSFQGNENSRNWLRTFFAAMFGRERVWESPESIRSPRTFSTRWFCWLDFFCNISQLRLVESWRRILFRTPFHQHTSSNTSHTRNDVNKRCDCSGSSKNVKSVFTTDASYLPERSKDLLSFCFPLTHFSRYFQSLQHCWNFASFHHILLPETSPSLIQLTSMKNVNLAALSLSERIEVMEERARKMSD